MAASTAPSPAAGRAEQWLTLLTGWHLLLAAGGLIAAVAAGQRPGRRTGRLAARGGAPCCSRSSASPAALAVYFFRRRNHRGRTHLAGDQLSWLPVLLHRHAAGRRLFRRSGHASADRFAGALPFLAGVLVGVLISSRSASTGQGRQIGRAVTWLSVAGFLLAIGLLNGLLALLTSLRNPVALAMVVGALLCGTMALGHVAPPCRCALWRHQRPRRAARRLSLSLPQPAGLSRFLRRPAGPLALRQLHQFRRLWQCGMDRPRQLRRDLQRRFRGVGFARPAGQRGDRYDKLQRGDPVHALRPQHASSAPRTSSSGSPWAIRCSLCSWPCPSASFRRSFWPTC